MLGDYMGNGCHLSHPVFQQLLEKIWEIAGFWWQPQGAWHRG